MLAVGSLHFQDQRCFSRSHAKLVVAIQLISHLGKRHRSLIPLALAICYDGLCRGMYTFSSRLKGSNVGHFHKDLHLCQVLALNGS